MPDKGFTTYFNLVDNFTAKFEAIRKRITSLTTDKYVIDFEVDDSTALKQTQELGNKLQQTTAGIGNAMGGADDATKKAAENQKEMGKTVDQNVSVTKRAGAAISELKSKYDSLSGSITKLVASFAAMATGGAIAGMAYLDAAKSNNRREDTVKAIAGNRKNQIMAPQLNEYLDSYKGSEWTSAGKMSDTLQATYLYGGKKARGQKGLDLADAAEKIAYAKQDSLGGMSGGDLMRSATLIKGKLRPQMEGEFRIATANVQSLPGYESMIKTASGRLKLLKKEAETINIKAEMDRHPWAVAQQNIADFKKAIGESIAGPMASISKIVARIARAMKDVPGFAGLVGWGAILTSVAGAASLLISVFTPLYTVLSKLGVITKLQAAYEWASLTVKQAWFAATARQAVASVTLTGANTAEAISVIGSNVATNVGIGTRLRLTAVNIYNIAVTKAVTAVNWILVASTNLLAAVYGVLTGRIALATVSTKASAAATVISKAVTFAAVGVMGALSAIYGLLTGRIALMTIATGVSTAAMVITGTASAAVTATLGIMSAASIVATGGFTALATAVWAALAPLLPFIAAGAIIVGILALVAAKMGILGPILKGLGSIDLGKVFKDLGKGDIGKAWRDLTKGFKLPSLSKMWGNLTSGSPDLGKVLGGMWDSIPKPDFGKMFGGLKEWVGEIFSNISVGGIIRGITGKGPEELLLFIADHLRVMLRWISTNIAPVTSRIHEILKKIQSVFEWVHGLFQRFWNWIQQAMPGAAKETKRLEIDKAISKQNASDKTKSLSYSRTSGAYTVRDMTVSSGSYHTLTENDYGKEKYKSLTKKSAEYQALPGFAEGIAQAVARGISGIGTTIADAIVGVIKDKLSLDLKFPESLTNLMDKINNILVELRTWLKDHGFGDSSADTPNGGYESDEFTAAKKSSGKYDVVYKNPGFLGPSMEFDLTEEQVQEKLKTASNVKQVAAPAPTNAKEPATLSAEEPAPIPITAPNLNINPAPLNAEDRNPPPEHGYRLKTDHEQKIKADVYRAFTETQKPAWEPYAVGATFKKGGLFAGRVHETEEITPQAITKRGPGPIAKAIDLLNNVTSGKRGMSSDNDVSGGEVHVHMPTQDFSGMKISSDVDFERLLRDANKKAVADAVYEMKKLIGQRRT